MKLAVTINKYTQIKPTYINIRRKYSKLTINNMKMYWITNQNITFSAVFTWNIFCDLKITTMHSTICISLHRRKKRKQKKTNKQKESSRKEDKKSILKSKF